ncbi:MAG TPA: hypothetical protein VG944_15005 [Fimbriimonas sp.]|nr:hypothetical protein [Fimbriimonas sp.]
MKVEHLAALWQEGQPQTEFSAVTVPSLPYVLPPFVLDTILLFEDGERIAFVTATGPRR